MNKYTEKRGRGRPKGSMGSNKHHKNAFSDDWESTKDCQTYRLLTIIKYQNTVQKKHLNELSHTENVKSNIATLYGKKKSSDKTFSFLGYKCIDCGKPFSDTELIDKHSLVCTNRDKINKSEDDYMPIQKITKDGETYYRWGQHGKLYKNRSDAEKQARAIYASGYDEKPKDNRGRPPKTPMNSKK
jgi:hypothetical protein